MHNISSIVLQKTIINKLINNNDNKRNNNIQNRLTALTKYYKNIIFIYMYVRFRLIATHQFFKICLNFTLSQITEIYSIYEYLLVSSA